MLLEEVYERVLDDFRAKDIVSEIEQIVAMCFMHDSDLLTLYDLEKIFEIGARFICRAFIKKQIIPNERRGAHGQKFFNRQDILSFFLNWALSIPLSRVIDFVADRHVIELSGTQVYRLLESKAKQNCFLRLSVPIKDVVDCFVRIEFERQIRQKWFTTQQLAKEKNVSIETVREWIRKGCVAAKMSRFQYYISPQEFHRVCSLKKISELAMVLNVSKRAIRSQHENGMIITERFNGSIVISDREVAQLVVVTKNGTMFKHSRNKIRRGKLQRIANNSSISAGQIEIFRDRKFGDLTVKDRQRLILAAKKGIKIAKEIIVGQLEYKVQQIGRQGAQYGIPAKDCAHYARVGIIEAIEKYPDFEVDFIGYACVYMKWTVFRNTTMDFKQIF